MDIVICVFLYLIKTHSLRSFCISSLSVSLKSLSQLKVFVLEIMYHNYREHLSLSNLFTTGSDTSSTDSQDLLIDEYPVPYGNSASYRNLAYHTGGHEHYFCKSSDHNYRGQCGLESYQVILLVL